MIEQCECARCGFTWMRGQSGSHDCASEFETQLAEAKRLLAALIETDLSFDEYVRRFGFGQAAAEAAARAFLAK